MSHDLKLLHICNNLFPIFHAILTPILVIFVPKEGKNVPRLFSRRVLALMGAEQNLGAYRNAQALFDFFSNNMPQRAPGSLPRQDYLNILAFILQSNGYLKEGAPMSLEALAGISLTK